MPTQNNTPLNNTQQKFSASHSFEIRLAQMYGLEEAILINHFIFWISFNQRLNRNKIEGRTWMYQSQEEMAAHYPYWNRKKINRIIKSLVDQKVLRSQNHNKNKQIRTLWYSFENESLFLQNLQESIKPDDSGQLLDKKGLRKDTNEQSYKGEDSETNTKKQQQGGARKTIIACPKPASFAAASSCQKEPSAKTQPAGEIKSKLLKAVPIPHSDKEWLENTYSLPTIDSAVTWATHPTTQLKKTLAAALKWFCRIEPAARPKIPEDEVADIEKNRQLAKQVEQKVTHFNGYEFIAANKLCYIDRGSYVQPIEIYYTTQNFKETLYKTLKDFHFKRKND